MKARQASLPLPDDPEDAQRVGLLEQYRRLVRVELPTAAREGCWPLRLDHCFARVILDGLFGACWYEHLQRGKGRSAESQLDAGQLGRALALGRGMLEKGAPEVGRLNAQSLRWRGRAG